MLLAKLLIVFAALVSVQGVRPYWPTFTEGLHLDEHPEEADPEKAKDPLVIPHETHHQHDFEFWEHYLDNHEEKDANHTHDDEIHFQNGSFGYETDHHCVYELRLNYIWGSPDGVWKRMIAYNGQFPGPTLYCTAGKTMIVRVTNDIEDDNEPTSVHWHGIQQTLTPFYDGPQAVAQCPLMHNRTMIYKFPVFQSGTYWYHSHHSYQYIEGNWGFLIIKQAPKEVWGNSYDDERLISLNDWTHRPARELVENYIEKGVDGGAWISENSTLINGRGSFDCALKEPNEICNPKLQGPAIVKVKQGKRYRFRVLNSAAQNAYNFSIDGHKMQVIETDGVDTEKSKKFDILYIIPGQRYSVIVIMDQPPGHYWMRAVSDPPELAGPPGYAILTVKPSKNGFEELKKRGAEPTDPDFDVGQGRAHYHNVPWDDIINSGGIPIPQSNQYEKYFPKDLLQFDLQYQQKLDAKHLKQLKKTKLPTTTAVDPSTAVQIDDLSDIAPLLFGPDGGRAPANYSRVITFNVTDCPIEGNQARLCINDESWTPVGLTGVPSLHEAIKGNILPANQVPVYTPVYQEAVRIVINNAHPWSHPWHLHGHTFWILGAGAENSGPFNATRDEPLLRLNGVRRDTLRTKGHSWAVIVYYTDNPGVWFFHCHVAWHLEAGLGATFIEAGDIARRIYHVAPYEAKKTCSEIGVKI